MSDGVRYIHTQAQAQAELDRQREMARAKYARKRQRRQQSSDCQMQVQSNTDQDTIRRRKQRGIQSDSFYIDPTTDADRMARLRRAQKEKCSEQHAEERADNKIQQRYYDLIIYIANII